jgi:ornithine carbamoyltransferase
MQTFLRGRDMITTQEWTRDEINTVMDVALELKRKRALGQPHAHLRDKVLAMLFFFSSTRTRASFEAGMAQLGGQPWRHGQRDRRDPRPVQRWHRHSPGRLGGRQQIPA